jgi:hypothetical protein
VYASSLAVSGQQKNFGERAATEADLKYGENQYAAHKVFNEWQAKDYRDKYGMIITGVRPANVTGPLFDLMAWNDAYAGLFPSIVERGTRANSLWCTFALPECCNPVVNREAVQRQLVAVFRSEYGKHVGEPVWESFLAELRLVSSTFADLWAQQQVAAPVAVEKIYRHAAVGEVRFMTTNLHVTAVPDARIVVFTPTDEETRQRVAWVRAHPEAAVVDHVH